MRLPSEARLRTDLTRALAETGESPGAQTIEALLRHLQLLAAWNDRYHLTTITSWREIVDRHIRESLLPLRWIGGEGRLLDIGTGNGFPALPILACRPALEAVLVERSEKKSLFLDAVVRETGRPEVRIWTCNAPRREVDSSEPAFDYVTSRATMAPERYLKVAASWARPGARVFLFAGEAGRAHDKKGKLRLIGEEPVAGRRDSSLWVFETAGA